MKKLARLIVDNYKVWLIIFAVLTIASCVGIPFVIQRLNSDIMSYLPEDTNTVRGLDFLYDNFGINADFIFGVGNADRDEAEAYVQKIDRLYYDDGEFYYASAEQLSQGTAPGVKAITQCLWIHSDFIETFRLLSGMNAEMQQSYASLLELLYSDNDTPADTSDDTYVFISMMEFSGSSSEAFKVIDIVKDDIVGDSGIFYAYGSTKMAKDIFSSTIGEVWKYTLAGLAVIILVLLLFTKSWIDPVIMFITLGISVVLNIGTNIIFPTNSIITFACSSLLQVALAMDYSVFLIHAYREECKNTIDRREALTNAIPRAFKSVFASALTTIGGFIALFFMRFGIGADMGSVLAKGILMSLITVIFLQPAIMILFSKKMDSWQHRAVAPKFRKPVKTVIKYRSVVVATFLVAIFPVVLYQSDLPLNYFNFVEYEHGDEEVYTMVDRASQQLIIAVPYDIHDDESVHRQYAYLAELRALTEADGKPSISFILGLNALIPEDVFMSDGGGIIDIREMIAQQAQQFVKDGYTMYTVGLVNEAYESAQAMDTVARMNEIASRHFSGDYYMTGLSQAASDFAAITPNDFQRVTVVSVLIIIAILFLTFKSAKHSVILILLIEFGIWLNLCLQRLSGTSINFMSYIVLSSIQLGATVDYAILITAKYRDFRKRMLPAHAAYMATTSSVVAVLTSATILAGACICVRLLSTVLIISQLTTLVARGAIISAILTLFVLPSALAFIDRPNKTKTMEIPEQSKLSHRKYLHKRAADATEEGEE